MECVNKRCVGGGETSGVPGLGERTEIAGETKESGFGVPMHCGPSTGFSGRPAPPQSPDWAPSSKG